MPRPDPLERPKYGPGELALFDDIVRCYSRHVYNVAYRLTGNEADAKDLAQETFLRVYRNLRKVQPGTPLEGWLYRIVTNLNIDVIRRRSRVRMESLDAPVPAGDEGEAAPRAIPDEAPGPEAEAIAAEFEGQVQQALLALPEDLRRVVVLADVEGFSYEEIGEMVGIPVGTVKSRLHRARGLLRERLRPLVEGRAE
ncbi:MAG: sigma-70 family RNA polymerase sigma factor [Armatimonadetes bacterium]|nr:sigma-70 family RNA polymerase sigma factor [Armatimonadota bacterium]